jgi:magnesium chelatase subunit D
MGGSAVSAEARFPFSAVVGQEDAKLALLLAAVDPRIGGVLLRGEKGSGKTTLARGLAALLATDSPFVDLPLGATEDRVIGTLDVAAALTGGEVRFHPGLLAAAHGGVLYVDEVNLLADHLVDTLLDVSVSGVNVVEREAVSHRHPARFVLVGSMNPEEGELRPQLLDRFGLCVSVTAPTDEAERVEVVRRRLAFDTDPPTDGPFVSADGQVARRLATSRPADIPEPVIAAAARLAVAVGAEGLRADLTLCRAAAAHAALAGRTTTTDDDLRRVAPLVLAHRARRSPFDPPVVPPEDLERAVARALDDDAPRREQPEPPQRPDPDEPDTDEPDADGRDAAPPAAAGQQPLPIGRERRAPRLERPSIDATRGRVVGDVAAGAHPQAPVAVIPTVRQLARRRAAQPDAVATVADLRSAVREQRAGRLVIVTVDLSGSMGAPERAEAASGTVLGLLTHAYERRDQVALVAFHGEGARVVLAPTASVEIARNRLGALTTGGETPLADGIGAALRIATTRGTSSLLPLIALLTDGRATGGADAVERALTAAAAVRAAGVEALVLDCETGPSRLGLAAQLAAAMGARCVPVAQLEASTICSIIRHDVGAG